MERNFSTTGTYLLKIPPFRDSHMHFLEDGKPASQEQLLEIKDKYKKHGIFSVNDMGHKTGIGLDAKKVIKRDMLIRSAGFAIYKKKDTAHFSAKGLQERKRFKVL